MFAAVQQPQIHTNIRQVLAHVATKNGQDVRSHDSRAQTELAGTSLCMQKKEVIAALQLLVEQLSFQFVATASGAAPAKISVWPAHHMTV